MPTGEFYDPYPLRILRKNAVFQHNTGDIYLQITPNDYMTIINNDVETSTVTTSGTTGYFDLTRPAREEKPKEETKQEEPEDNGPPVTRYDLLRKKL